MSGDQLDLDAIEGRARALTYALGRDHIGAVASFGHTVGDQDVPALVAEVRRLREQVATWENVDRLAMTTGYTHAQAAEQVRAVVALADGLRE